MKRAGHIIGLIFALVLLTAAKSFLVRYPMASSGFLMFASFFYMVCTYVSGKAFFLYPVMFSGALSYYLCLYGIGVSPVWYPAHSLFLVFLLRIAKRAAFAGGKTAYSNAFKRGINATALIFTVWAVKLAGRYWGGDPAIYIVPFFGYAAFYFLRNQPGQEKRTLTYAWMYYLVSGFVALAGINGFPVMAKPLMLSALVFALAHTGMKKYRAKGYGDALPFLSGILVTSLFSFISSRGEWNATAVVFFLNSIAFWFVYRSMKEDIVGTKISTAGEKFFMILFKTGFMVLPVLFWIKLLRNGFPPGYVNVVISAGYAVFFARLTLPPYKSLLKNRNHYVYLSGAFICALFYLVIFSFGAYASKMELIMFTPALIGAIFFVSMYFRKTLNQVKAASVSDVVFLPVVMNAVLMISSGNLNSSAALVLAGTTMATLFIFLAVLKEYTICYSICAVVWCGLLSALGYLNIAARLFAGAYLTGSVLFAVFAYLVFNSQKEISKVFRFSMILFSLSAFYFSSGNIDQRLAVFLFMAIAYLSVGAQQSRAKKTKSILPLMGHIAAVWAILTVFSARSLDQSVYTAFSLAAAYFIPFVTRKRSKYAYPAGVLASAGYLLFLIKICSADWVMMAYLPLVVVLLFRGARSLPALVSAYFASAIVVLWTFGANIAHPAIAAVSSLLFGAVYAVRAKGKVFFCTSAAGFILAGSYFLLRSIFPPEQALIFSGIVSFCFFVAGMTLRKTKKLRPWDSALIISGASVLLAATAISAAVGFITATKVIVVISSLAYLLAALVFQLEIFLYLLTLNISILFFNFLQTAGTIFTQDLFVYFLYGVVLLGVFFVMPHIKRSRRYERVFMMFTIKNWKGVLLYSIPVCAVLVIVAMLYMIKITEHPQFCGSCHYMDDYIETWEHSSHKDVKCVDCHYEPGVKAIAKGKIDGMLQLAKYMTHTYSSMPAGEVSDLSCLRRGCHDKMDTDAPVVFGKNVKFKHSSHLGNAIKNQKLKCTTCHSQLNEGEHLSVSKSACYICHFKKTKKDQQDCKSCHNLPKETPEFDHAYVADNIDDVNCADCHEEINAGTGKVIDHVCLFCHKKKVAKKKISVKEMHLKHVTENKVECFQCHETIKHGEQEGI